MKKIMDCITTPAVNFRTRLGFKQHDPIMTQEQSTLSKIVTLFAIEKIILQHNVLGYRIDAYFPKYKLATEVDEQGNKSRDIDCEIERQTALEIERNCKFIRINAAKVKFSILVEIGKILCFIVKSTEKLTEESTKKSIIDDLNLVIMAQYLSLQKTLLDTSCLHYKNEIKSLLFSL